MDNTIYPSEEGACSSKEPSKSRKRKMSRSSSSDSSSSSDTSSSASSVKHDYKRKKRNKRSTRNRKFDKLLSKISELESKISCKFSGGSVAPEEDCSSCVLDPNISGELYDDEPFETQQQETTGNSNITAPPCDPQFEFSVSTKIKEPTVPVTSSAYLEHLKLLQHFEQADWKSVRYTEAQKQYVHAPGFTSLEANTEVTNYDNSKFTAHMETAFSGLTFALIKQSEVIRNDMRDFLNWVQQEGELTHAKIFTKLNSVFSDGEYPKITGDLFQMACGHRAELIQYRRDAILASVKDPVHKEVLKKIPPSCTALFEEDKFTAVLDKAGGVRNVFWPKNKGRTANAPQNNPGPSAKQPNLNRQNQKPFRNETKNYVQPKTGPNHSQRGKSGRNYRGHREQYKGRKTGSPSSHRERSSQHKRKY